MCVCVCVCYSYCKGDNMDVFSQELAFCLSGRRCIV